MRPVKIKGQNAEFGKPPNWDDAALGPCGALPLRREVVGAGTKAFMSHYSNWKPSPDEVAALQAGGVVELECCSLQPAVSVIVVPCADPDISQGDTAPLVTEQYLRDVLADAIEREGCGRLDTANLAVHVRNGSDNSFGGMAAMAALRRVVGLVCRCEGRKAGHDEGCPLAS